MIDISYNYMYRLTCTIRKIGNCDILPSVRFAIPFWPVVTMSDNHEKGAGVAKIDFKYHVRPGF